MIHSFTENVSFLYNLISNAIINLRSDTMTYEQVVDFLISKGSEQTIKIYKSHGADIDLYGVSIANLKSIAKKLKGRHDIGMRLLYSNNVDQIYLSQYVLDPTKLHKEDFEYVIASSNYYMILDNVVAPLIARNEALAFDLLYEYLDDINPRKRQVAYSLYGMILGSYNDTLIDYDHVMKTLEVVKKEIHNEQNRVRYSMNNFIIAAGASNLDITEYSKGIALEVGKVDVFMGKTSCKVPDALPYIKRIEAMGNIGKKRKL
jgi:hypothetical protein